MIKPRVKAKGFLFLSAFGVSLIAPFSTALEIEVKGVYEDGRLTDVTESARIIRSTGVSEPVSVGSSINVGDEIEKLSNVIILLETDSGGTIILDEDNEYVLREKERRFYYTLGRIYYDVRSWFSARTKVVSAGTKNTEFNLLANETYSRLVVLRGVMEVTDGKKTVTLKAGEAINADEDGLGDVEKVSKVELGEIRVWATELKSVSRYEEDTLLFLCKHGVAGIVRTGDKQLLEDEPLGQARLDPYSFVRFKSEVTVTSGIAFMTPDEAKAALVNSSYEAVLSPDDPEAHLTLGHAYLNYRLYQQALEEYELALDTGLDDTRIYQAIGDAKGLLGETEEATKYYKKALKEAPKDVDLRLALASAYLAIGENKKAGKEYEKVSKISKKAKPKVYISRAKSYFKDGQYELALDELCIANELDPNNEEVLLLIGEGYFKLGQYENSLPPLEEAILIDPAYFEAYNLKAASLMSLGRYKDAIICYDKMIELEPNIPDLYHIKAKALFWSREYAAAIAYNRKAIELNPKYGSAYADIGASLSNLDRNEEAIEYYDRALAIEPDSPDVILNKCIALAEIGEHAIALRLYDEYLAKDPVNKEMYLGKGIFFENMNRHDEAIASYDIALAIDPGYLRAYEKKGEALIHSGRTEEAIACYEAALKANPEYGKGYTKIGDIYFEKGEDEKALEFYDRALSVMPTSVAAIIGKGRALTVLNRTPEAIAVFTEVLKTDANNAAALVYISFALEEQGQYSVALDYLDKGISGLREIPAWVWIMKADLHRDLGQFEKAVECYDRALTIEPNDYGIYVNKGVALSEMGDLNDAIRCYDKGLLIKPDSWQLYNNKALVLWKLGRNAEAVDCFDKANRLKTELYQGESVK